MNAAAWARSAVFAALLAWPNVVRAADAADTAAQWGLLGSWALDCAKPPTLANGYQIYVRRGDELLLERDFGDRHDSSEIVSATVLPDGALELYVAFDPPSQPRTMAFAKRADRRMRVLFNHDAEGSFTAKNGRFVANGKPTPWQTRCP